MPKTPVKELNPRQAKFLKYVKRGNTQQDSAVLAGYSKNSARSIAHKLMRKAEIQASLHNAGLTSDSIAKSLNTAVTSGLGIKATNSDAISAIRLTAELGGYLDKDKDDTTSTTININELKILNVKQLQDKLQRIDDSIKDNT